jgi:hypothetical protein
MFVRCCGDCQSKEEHRQGRPSARQTTIKERQARNDHEDQICADADVHGIVLSADEVLVHVHLPRVGSERLGLHLVSAYHNIAY